MLQQFTQGARDFRDDVTSHIVISSRLSGEARLVLQNVAAWTEQAEVGENTTRNGDGSLPLSALAFHSPSGQQKSLPHSFSQLRDALQNPPSPSSSLGASTTLRIPQVRSKPDQNRSVSAENGNKGGNYHRSSLTESTASLCTASAKHLSFIKVRPPFLAQSCPDSISQLPHRLGPHGSSLEELEDGGCQDADKQPRKKRGRYRQYDHELMEEAITMVMAGRMSVSKAQGVYGVPHSTLEYKVKERTGTLKNPPKKRSTTFCSSSSNSSKYSTMTSSTNSGSFTSAADAQRS